MFQRVSWILADSPRIELATQSAVAGTSCITPAAPAPRPAARPQPDPCRPAATTCTSVGGAATALGAGAPLAPGMVRLWPTRSSEGLRIELAATMAAVVVP